MIKKKNAEAENEGAFDALKNKQKNAALMEQKREHVKQLQDYIKIEKDKLACLVKPIQKLKIEMLPFTLDTFMPPIFVRKGE